jgi:hypothetical protein
MVIRSCIGIGLQRVGGKERCCKSRTHGDKFGNAGTDCIPIRGAPDENHFAMLRTGEMSVDSVPFLKSKKRFRLYPQPSED